MDPIEAHLDHLRQSRRSASTLRHRERVLRSLPGDDPFTLGRDDMAAWWRARGLKRGGKERATSSLSQEASHVRRFFRWGMRQGLVDHNAADWLPDLKVPRPAVKPVQEGDLFRLMNDAPEEMRRMIALAAMAGLRSTEIAAVRWEDIDRGNGVLWIRLSKGDTGRTVPLSAGLLASLGDPATGPIIGREMTGKAVSQAIGRYMRRHGVDFTAHKLRARYATRFLAATGDLKSAADALGHADLSSISRYVVASSDTMRRGAEAAGRIG